MKLRWKKQIFSIYTIGIILLMPILSFLLFGFNTGLLPDFWYQMYPGESAAGDDLWIFSHMRYAFSFVEAMESYFTDIQAFLPILISLTVIPFIQMRDQFLPFARTRIKKARHIEGKWIVQTVLLSGCTVFLGYLLTMFLARLMFVSTYYEDSVFDVFLSSWGWMISAQEHPYLYVILLGVFRCLLLALMYSLLTIAISYISNKIYIYLLVPTVYNLLAYSWFAQGVEATTGDGWPLPLFSPENLEWPRSLEYWGSGHNVHGIWGVVGAILFVMLPSIIVIWWQIRKREV